MRYKVVFSMLLSLFVGTANANWTKINEVDYTWGPFNIYNITLFTEKGIYTEGTRPLMLTLQYKKPWEGRDFAVSLARTWNNLGIKLPEKEVDEVITHLRKTFPDIKPEDNLHYIALEDRGYFILNDKVVSDIFNKEFSDAIVAIWLDPKMDISRQLLDPSYKAQPKPVEAKTEEVIVANTEKKAEETEVEENVKLNSEKTIVPAEQELSAKAPSMNEKVDAVPALSNITSESHSEGSVEKAGEVKQTEIKSEEKSKQTELENPEIFISPIYDDFLMLSKNYI
ncbi:dihydroorotate dehydrogenase [Mannheimia granulomatis]|uniref:Dihydroorotate dehydrogenase n=1 Tax=Mannheimia granulomatis TaxID=85402 RepID=A0A6G8JJP4_9PAST|nr:dihydroorotate dehydrogenase [Mannheimia granulomatis]QIM67078.1 dihydroorotate dehydrogenase [Mannheimia granulomatis]